jgi:hypothetical protein
MLMLGVFVFFAAQGCDIQLSLVIYYFENTKSQLIP